jgi:hypothetical protein
VRRTTSCLTPRLQTTVLTGIPTLAPHFGFSPPVLPPPIYKAIRDPTVPPAPNEVMSDETLHFDYHGSDIILRSRDSYNFRLLKSHIELCSPVLRNLIQSISNISDAPNDGEEQEPLPVVKLPESKATLYSLLTFIFPTTPVLPPSAGSIMELLAVAQKYQMDSVSSHIRGAIAQQDPPFIRPETAFHIYCLAQQHGLHREVVQAARVTFRLPMVIEELGDRLCSTGMTGAYLHGLRKHHERVRTDLQAALLQFRSAGLPDNVKSLLCTPGRIPQSTSCNYCGRSNYSGYCDYCGRSTNYSSSNNYTTSFPQWLNDYVNSIAEAPHLFNPIDFNSALTRHFQSFSTICSCANIPSEVLHSFWEALTAVVHTTIENVCKIGATSGFCRDS